MYTKEELLTEIKGDLLSDDPDHTKAAREFYAAYWKDTLSGDILDYDGEYGNFRGGTILTFNTMAGCAIRLTEIYRSGLKLPDSSEERLAIIMNQKDIPDYIAELFEMYHKQYHCLANFMPLIKANDNMNLIKGGYTHNFHDMPDLFYEQVRIYYETGSNEREMFYNKANVEYFKKFKDWKGYVEGNYLQNFLSHGKTTFTPLLIEINGEMPRMPFSGKIAYSLGEKERSVCFEQIEGFLTMATTIIKWRAGRLSKVKI